MSRSLSITLISLITIIAVQAQQSHYAESNGKIILTQQGASHLASLPLKCIEKKFPFKPWYVISDTTFSSPQEIHPAFCGCFDWHSSVHGHWLLVALLKQYPEMPEADSIVRTLQRHLSEENIRTELALFTGDNKTFERPYGWAWILQLQNELLTWDSEVGKALSYNLDPLARHIAHAWIGFLDKLQYPVREPEHFNSAFSMCLAWDYAITVNDTALRHAIRDAAMRFFINDVDCPTAYEPGGYDFLSPCLEEADLMQRILPEKEFHSWLKKFLPGLYHKPAALFQVGIVSDPTDGKMAHLDGLNFSRAWCLYNIADRMPVRKAVAVRELALEHLKYSLPHVATGAYEGDHWLGTYVVYALRTLGR